ncbi:MAG: CBS domain-containing protein [Actinobacteria bacterium]|nr:CBS domain-containing protein [Actinomycetota bacterium]
MESSDCSNPKVDREAAETRVSEAMVSAPKAMSAHGTVADLRAMFTNPHVRTALLVDGPEFAGVVHRDALPDDAPDDQPAGELADRDVPTISPDAPLSEAVRVLDATGDNRLVVLDPDGRTLRGLLCLTGDRSGFCQS